MLRSPVANIIKYFKCRFKHCSGLWTHGSPNREWAFDGWTTRSQRYLSKPPKDLALQPDLLNNTACWGNTCQILPKKQRKLADAVEKTDSYRSCWQNFLTTTWKINKNKEKSLLSNQTCVIWVIWVSYVYQFKPIRSMYGLFAYISHWMWPSFTFHVGK